MIFRRPDRKRILILGGGFAGLAAARELRADRHDVTLIDRNRWFEFLPNIHELLSRVKTPELLRLPLEITLERLGHRFMRDTVTGIDPIQRTVSTRRRKSIPYDSLIVTFGGVDVDRGVAGVVEHAHPFKTVEQCDRIGKRLARLAVRRKPARVVIVGGGLEGVEALGEILRRYRDSRLHVTLVEANPRLLPEAPAYLDEQVRKLSAPWAVDFVMNSPVRKIEPAAVILDDGSELPSDLTIWTGGPAPPALLAECDLAPRDAWAPVDQTLASTMHSEIFVAGDAAAIPTALPKQAYNAIDMGACAARNADRLLRNRTPENFRPSAKPMLISFGDLTCFLVAGERALSGPSVGALKEVIFELVMSQLDAQPIWTRCYSALQRTEKSARKLLWPAISSHAALKRQGSLTLLTKS